MKSPKHAVVQKDRCVACGACMNECPCNAIVIIQGCYASINSDICVGCGLCASVCPAGSIDVIQRENQNE